MQLQVLSYVVQLFIAVQQLLFDNAMVPEQAVHAQDISYISHAAILEQHILLAIL